jgi:hypothetical protein
MTTAQASRRSFIRRLGLSAGAAVLSPIADSLVAEAQGGAQVGQRKRFAVFMVGNGMSVSCSSFVPAKLKAEKAKALISETDFPMPAMAKNLESLRGKILWIDGLSNQVKGNDHSAGWAALSAMSHVAGAPGGPTIDQFVGRALGTNTRMRALLAGSTHPGMFALATGQPNMHYTALGGAFHAVFGTLVKTTDGVSKGALEQRLVLDRIRDDVKRLQAGLAGSERRKLDQYLAAIEDFEERQKAPLLGSCSVPAAAAGVPPNGPPEDRLAAFNDLQILALACGITNVTALAAATGHSHHDFHRYTKIHVGTQFESQGGIDGYGHDGCGLQGPAMDIIHNFHCGLMARMAGELSRIREGDRSIFENMVMIYLSDSGGEHHSDYLRFPVLVVGDAGGKLRTGGRYLRYPDKGERGARSLADFYRTLASALGVPHEGFAAKGPELVTGPLGEILT